MFGYVTGGYDVINKKFAEHLQKNGVEFYLNETISTVMELNSGLIGLTTPGNKKLEFDHVISTLSPMQSVKLVSNLPEEERDKHRKVKYLGVICPSVLLKKAISPYYVTNITDTGTPFTGIIEMSALIDKNEELKGRNLVYLPKYVDTNDPLFDSDENEIRRIFLGALFKMYPELSEKDVVHFGVSKARIVFALPTINYSADLPGIKTSLENFYIINSAQIINGTLNVNETIQVAESKLKIILNEQ
jgi:protoporphyrinogen oxidase